MSLTLSQWSSMNSPGSFMHFFQHNTQTLRQALLHIHTAPVSTICYQLEWITTIHSALRTYLFIPILLFCFVVFWPISTYSNRHASQWHKSIYKSIYKRGGCHTWCSALNSGCEAKPFVITQSQTYIRQRALRLLFSLAGRQRRYLRTDFWRKHTLKYSTLLE